MALLTTQQIKPTTTAVNQQKPVAQVAPLPKAATKVGNIPVQPVTKAAAVYQPKAINATTREVSGNELVENRLNNLISSNSEYIKLAEAKAKEQSAGRGLLNSSLAAGAGRAAAISAALPIAQQDASTYATQALTNQQATNQFSLQDKQFEQQKGLLSQEFANTTARDSTLFGYDMAKQTQQQGWQSGESALDRQQQLKMSDKQFDQQKGLLQQEFINTTARDKTLYGYDLGKMDKDFANASVRDKTLYNYDLSKQQQAQGWQAQQTEADRKWQAEQAKVQAEQQAALTEKRDKLLASLQTKSQKDTLDVEIKRMQAEFDFRAKESALNMSQQNRMAFAEAQNRLMNQYLESMQSIYQNSGMNPEQQEAAVAKMRSEVQAQLDLTSLLFAGFSGIGGATTPTGPITKPNPVAIIPKPDIGQLTGGNTKPGRLPTLDQLVGQQPAQPKAPPKTNAEAGWKITSSARGIMIVTGPNGETKRFNGPSDATAFLAKAPDK